MPESSLLLRFVPRNARARGACTIVFLVLTSSLFCYSADVVFVRSGGSTSGEQHELEVATQFYGVNLTVIAAGDGNFDSVLDAIRKKSTLAVAIDANALALVKQDALLRALRRDPRSGVPLLVLGVTSQTEPSLLSTWSGGAVVDASQIHGAAGLRYLIGAHPGFTGPLSNREIPFPGNDSFYFELAGDHKAQAIMSVRNNQQTLPVFIEANVHQQKVFLLSRTRAGDDGLNEETAGRIEPAFAEVAPVLMFVKYSAGERGWHALHHYANLTIDDPWLREPYGGLSYKGLLGEMEQHNFHTTIAFIPWNYDRNETQTVALVRNHPERFSICIHGNDHDHKEFEDLESKPLNIQVGDLKQALARMAKFQELTGIPYDSVFVFPHSIGTESALKELKTYNFSATINSTNVPMDRKPPSALLFALRPVTLSFADFPSISRYTAAMRNPNSFLGINEFLDNPLFFYTHHDFFVAGIGAFDSMADAVNKSEPDTRWRSVGEIVKHLYLVRLRDDSNYDVLAFSNNVELENTFARDLVFDVRRPEFGSQAIASVSIDGQDYPFMLQGGELSLRVPVRAGETRSLVILYKNDLNLRSISTAHDSLRVDVLRMVSDYRDITLSQYHAGLAVTNYYYKHGVTPLLAIVVGGTLILFSVGGVWILWVVMKRKNPVAGNTNVVTKDQVARAAGRGQA